jgi:cystathionine beta-lyase family protein involved in aluminum resistance
LRFRGGITLFSNDVLQVAARAELRVVHKHKEVDRMIDQNQWRILEIFRKHKVSDFHFAESTGYGYNDRGREVLDLVYADVFQAEAALVRPHFASGTATIATALFGVLRPGDQLVYVGRPYDTLHKVIGKPNDGKGSLMDFGITYDEVSVSDAGEIDWVALEEKIKQKETKVVGIQRSRGYDWRPSFTIAAIKVMIERMKVIRSDIIVFVDNCYGEFTEGSEPCSVGADLIAGSLIKNPGGGLATSGGYIAGKAELVEKAANRLTAPGIGSDVGAMFGANRSIFQGLFLAPHLVGQALKGSLFAASIFEELGIETQPKVEDPRTDLIQALRFKSEEHLITFVQSIQAAAAIDAHVTPVPWAMPGYEHEVIMAAGTFIQGGSLELSADAPIREPYIAFMQGGLTYSHVKYAVLLAITKLKDKGLL